MHFLEEVSLLYEDWTSTMEPDSTENVNTRNQESIITQNLLIMIDTYLTN